MIEFQDVMWDVTLDGVVIGYVEVVSGRYDATAPDGSTFEGSSMLTDAGGWLHQKAMADTQKVTPRGRAR